MKYLSFESITTLKLNAPVADHYFLLRSLPISFGGQHILSANLKLLPAVSYTTHYDNWGNLNEVGRIPFPHSEFIYTVSGAAQIDSTLRQQEPLHPLYQYPSHYTHINREMIAFIEALHLKSHTLDTALKLADIIFHYMTYQSGATNTDTTAMDAFTSHQGVCQDYAHIYIALMRYLGIPARYANGLTLGTGQSHAWTEVYLNSMWQGIDPTHNCMVQDDYIRFCVGRDFRDCALERGVLYGNMFQYQETVATVQEQS